ncbi:hypothetical protein GSH19_04685 [Lactobacillus sp. S2-2]|uniref:hypothetical protein n=1 Tax=Lactobacillus sp. S2-2 TaxID=2692917 RepID=UPI001F20D91F|nr:hypothetical protein [Lactobacillus sp. S2-2]MCF6515448.1 hypothetical protein [Lactobacillus sp. S2-2]
MSTKDLVTQVQNNNQQIKDKQNKVNMDNDNNFCNDLFNTINKKLQSILDQDKYVDSLVVNFDDLNQSIYTKEDFVNRFDDKKYPFEKKYAGIIMNKKMSEIEKKLSNNDVKAIINRDNLNIKFVVNLIKN